VWGTENKVDTPEQCCAQCAAYKPQHEDDIYCNGAPFSAVTPARRRLPARRAACHALSLSSACARDVTVPVPVPCLWMQAQRSSRPTVPSPSTKFQER
jgi:hypothetical protein